MAWTIYRSTDGSAPTLNGTTGALITVLDAILVDGYGTQPAAGWSKAYSGTNKAAYRMGAAAAARMYFRVLDDGSHAQGAKEASIRGWESMSDVDTGTDGFPTVAQVTNGMQIAKSTTADSTARAWIAAADDRTCLFFTQADAGSTDWFFHYFGEIYSYTPSDAYGCLLAGQAVGSAIGSGNHGAIDCNTPHSSSWTMGSQYLTRLHTGVGTSVQAGKLVPTGMKRTGTLFNGWYLPQVNPADGGVYLSEILVVSITSEYAVRGRLRGFWHSLHSRDGWTDNDAFSGSGTLADREFEMLFLRSSSADGVAALETSDTVESN
jgi:hypothetical protein